MSKRCSYSKMAELNQCNSNLPSYSVKQNVFKIPGTLNDPYNPASYYINMNKKIQQNLGLKEDFVPLDFGESGGGLKRIEQAITNQQSLQQQIIQIHKQEAMQQEKISEDKKNKLQKLKLIAQLQKTANEQEQKAGQLLASEIKELSASISYD